MSIKRRLQQAIRRRTGLTQAVKEMGVRVDCIA